MRLVFDFGYPHDSPVLAEPKARPDGDCIPLCGEKVCLPWI
jgi:hypothetical protein